MTTDNANLSPYGKAVNQFKKAAKSFDKDVSTGIEYEMMKLIEADQNRRIKFDLKIKLIAGMRELQKQYKELFNDYAEASGKFADNDYPFSTVLNNEDSAYNKTTDLINLLSKTIL